jgi:hypothetical protein
VLALTPAPAQQPTSPTWALSRALKVEPAKTAEFEKFYRDTVKKYHAAQKAAGSELGWTLSKVVLPNGTDADVNYVSTSYFDKFPPLDEEPSASAIEKAGTTPEKFRTAVQMLRTLVRTTVSRRLETLGPREPGDFVRVDYMRVAPGKSADYINLEQTVYRALHERRRKEGILKSWSLNAVVFPGGSDRKYDFFTTNAVKSSADLGGIGSGYTTLFAKVHPDLNLVAVTNRTQELRTIVATRVLHLMEVLQ